MPHHLGHMRDEGADAAGHLAAADINGVDQLPVARIIVFEQRDQPSGGEILGDMEAAEPGDAQSADRDLVRRLAIIDQHIARHGLFEIALSVAERPAGAGAAEIEADAVVRGQIGGQPEDVINKSRALFMLADMKLVPCNKMPGDTCIAPAPSQTAQ